MRQVLFLGVIAAFLPALLLIGTGSAFAQAAQTPLGTFAFSTATPVPSTATQTPLPPCASGISNISGLDPNWLASCGHCVTTPTPTSQYVIGTPSPTWSGTEASPTAELTSTPTGSPTPGMVIQPLDDITLRVYGGGSWPNGIPWNQASTNLPVSAIGPRVGLVVRVDGINGCNERSSGGDFAPFGGGVQDLDPGNTYLLIPSRISLPAGWNSYPTLAAAFPNDQALADWRSTAVPQATIISYGLGIVPPENTNPSIEYMMGYYCSSAIYADFIHEGVVVYGELVETPTPGGPSMDCLQAAYRNETPIVSYGGFQQLGGTCYTLIPGFSFTIPSIFGLTEEFTLGADTYQLCVQWYSFPELAILTLQIPLDLVILPAAVWLFRRFMEL